MREIYLGLGSNLGDAQRNITRATELLEKNTQVIRGSSLYRTEPVGFQDQDWFLNCAIEVESELPPRELLSFVLSVEEEMGRVRTIPGGPRTIDIDILFYGPQVIEEEGLKVPHPRLHERLFVLAPLAELCPGFVHPVLETPVGDLADRHFSRQAIQKLAPFQRL